MALGMTWLCPTIQSSWGTAPIDCRTYHLLDVHSNLLSAILRYHSHFWKPTRLSSAGLMVKVGLSRGNSSNTGIVRKFYAADLIP